MVLDSRFHIWFILILYYKMWQKFITKCDSYFLQNATEVYYKMRQIFYYKMRQLLLIATILLQNAPVITNATFITNPDSATIFHSFSNEFYRRKREYITRAIDKFPMLIFQIHVIQKCKIICSERISYFKRFWREKGRRYSWSNLWALERKKY